LINPFIILKKIAEMIIGTGILEPFGILSGNMILLLI
jgi:hypothetical protein